MNQSDFNAILDRLSAKQRDYLRGFLQGKGDAEIARELGVQPDTVRHHITNVANRFGLRESSGERCRPELIDLFAEFKSDWVAPQLRDRYRLNKEAPDTPGSVMAVDSPFYMEPAVQGRCWEEIQKPGALLRLRSPQQMGKTSLLQRILAKTEDLGYRRVEFNLRHDLDPSDLVGLPQFWTGFCRKVVVDLGLEEKSLPTTKPACTRYFQNQILPEIAAPLVLALDEADVLFEYPEIANDFFPLLRVWHNSAKIPGKQIWKQLRQVIVHSTEDYCLTDQSCSPFANVGYVAKLSPLSAGHGVGFGATVWAEVDHDGGVRLLNGDSGGTSLSDSAGVVLPEAGRDFGDGVGICAKVDGDLSQPFAGAVG